MIKLFGRKIHPLLLVGLALMMVVPVIMNRSAPREDSDDITPPIDAKDEGDRLIQMASENLFYREYPKAAENYRKAIALFESRENFARAGKVYESLGDLYKRVNETEEAERHYLNAVNDHNRGRNPLGEARALKDVGDLYMDQSRFDSASHWYHKALNLVRDREPSRVKAVVHESMGRLHWKTGKIPEATDQFLHAQETFAALGYQLGYEHMATMLREVRKEGKLRGHTFDSRPYNKN